MFCDLNTLWGVIKMSHNIFHLLLKKMRQSLSFLILLAFSIAQANGAHNLQVFRDMLGENPAVMNPMGQKINSDRQAWIENRCQSLNQAGLEYDLLIHQTSLAIGASASVGFVTLFLIPSSMLKEVQRSRTAVRKDFHLMQKEYQYWDNVADGKLIDEIQDPQLRQRVLTFYQQRESAHRALVDQSNLDQRTFRSWAKKSVITGGVFMVPSLVGVKWLHEKAKEKKAQIDELQDILQKELGENSKAKCREL